MKKPLLIGIGGAHSGIGKTTLAAALLKHFTSRDRDPLNEDPGPLNFSVRKNFRGLLWGAIKYTRSEGPPSLVDDRSVLSREGKDTRKMLDAGAEEVLWVQSPPGELKTVLPTAVDRLSRLDGIIIEGNSAIEFLTPDIVIFLDSTPKEAAKPSAGVVRERADIIVTNESSRSAPGGTCCSSQDVKELIRCIEMKLMRKGIEELLKEKSTGGRIPCALARKIAEDLGVTYKEVGATADALKIKIKNCEFGCF